MSQHKQSTVAYAIGFLEDYIENNTEPLDVIEGQMTDEQIASTVGENEHREQVRAMMKVVSAGLTQLSRENATLLNKIFLALAALSN